MLDPQAKALALSRAEGALGLVPPNERADVEHLLRLLTEAWGDTPRSPPLDRTQLLVVGARLAEVLARRSSSSMPYAALARAYLAEVRGDFRAAADLLSEFEAKLVLLGL